MVNLKIDGKDVQVEKGATILAAAEKVGIKIPTLCFLKKVSPTGACRVCVVEIKGVDKLMTACNTRVVDGMDVTTQSDRLQKIRKEIVQLLLVNHPLDCPVCDAAGECDLQNICFDLDVTTQPFTADDVNHEAINGWPLIQQVPNRCVLCEKCVKVCHETIGSGALFVNDKGDRTFIDKDLDLCEFCGNCVSVCPTGTMISKPFKFKSRPWEMTRKASVCTTCGSHCQVDINVKNGQVYRLTSDDEGTVNNGNLCVGGFFGHAFIHSPQRLERPTLKDGGAAVHVSWDKALGAVADKLQQIRQESGAAAIAGLASGRLSNEENYLFQKFFRVAIGSNNIDSGARFGVLEAYKALRETLGYAGSSNALGKIGASKAVLVFGSDVTAEAPAVDWQIEKACRKNDAPLVLANMRSVKLRRHSNTFLGYRPGSEVALANALARLILDKGLADEDYLGRFVGNLDDMKRALTAIDLDKAIQETGVSLQLLEEAAEHLGKAKSVSVIFGRDILAAANAGDKTRAIVSLALVCGALHGDIGGLFPVHEEGNMQGLLDMGVCPEFLPGFQDYSAARGKFDVAWRTALPQEGFNALQMLEQIEKGNIRALYLAATNPLVSFPESARWRKALEKIDFLIVQDIFDSELTKLAHVVLPGTSFAEKTGSVTALDGRISCLGQAIEPVGEAREDWTILAELYNRVSRRTDKINTEVLLREAKELTSLYGDLCFAGEGLCKPCRKLPFAPEEKSLQFIAATQGDVEEGLQLLVGKNLFHFDLLTTHSPANLEIAPEGRVEMNPATAATLQVVDGEKVQVVSQAGSATGKVCLTDKVPQGLLFATYHFVDLNIQQVVPQGQNLVKVEIRKA